MRILAKSDWFHEDGFPIVVERRDPQLPFGIHQHEFSEIVFITGGHGLHLTGEDSYELNVGDVFVIGGDRPHDYLNMQDLQLINVLFDPVDLPMRAFDLPALPGYHAMFTLEPAFRKQHQFSSRLRLTPAELVSAIETIDQMEQELTDRLAGFETVVTSSFLQLVAFLSRCYQRSQNRGVNQLVEIGSAIAHIERHYDDPITLDELVEISGMPRRSFIRAFESSMGMPPMKYLNRHRIRRACELLQRDDLTISEIATMVGFRDSNYFARQFRARMGAPPTAYRQRYPS